MLRIATLAIGVTVASFSSPVFGQTHLPAEAKGYLEFIVGSWEYTDLDNQNGMGTNEWAPGKHCVICNTTTGDIKSTALIGWDPVEKAIFETWYRRDGRRYVNRITNFSKNGWTFKGTVHLPNQAPQDLDLNVTIAKDGQSFSATTKDGKTITFRRIK